MRRFAEVSAAVLLAALLGGCSFSGSNSSASVHYNDAGYSSEASYDDSSSWASIGFELSGFNGHESGARICLDREMTRVCEGGAVTDENGSASIRVSGAEADVIRTAGIPVTAVLSDGTVLRGLAKGNDAVEKTIVLSPSISPVYDRASKTGQSVDEALSGAAFSLGCGTDDLLHAEPGSAVNVMLRASLDAGEPLDENLLVSRSGDVGIVESRLSAGETPVEISESYRLGGRF
ncbi:MAG: hypothetical protein SOW06_10665 [Succinivibrionaceae bacterium]|nr:hypothetical protein [Succinivibrionaceae bacterium]